MAPTYGSKPSAAPSLDGILLVDKPSGPTSHDIVDDVRRRFRLEKVGHAGTLDPQATGLLVLMLGRATKLANELMAGDKVYEGVALFGQATDTQDADGKIIFEGDASLATREGVEAEMRRLTGDLLQTPPMVSAAKKNGVPLYKLARQGKEVERKPKLVHLYEFTLLDFTSPRASFRLHCSKGVYVRTLCHDIGMTLKCGAHLEQLRRTKSGDFNIQDAATMETIMALDPRQLAERTIPLHRIRFGAHNAARP